MREYQIGTITYFVNDEQNVDCSIVYNISESRSISRRYPSYEYMSELWTIDGINIMLDDDNTEKHLRELWKNGGIPFALDHAYWKGGTLIYFAYPYNEHDVSFKDDTRRILTHITENYRDHYLWPRLERYIEYETFFLDHSGGLNELFRDFYIKYLKNNHHDAYYAIYYYLVRLGYWYMDYYIHVTCDSKLYINRLGDESLYLDHDISSELYDTLDMFFNVSHEEQPSPDD